MRYETVIGLEVHAELSTETKIFCGCKNAFGGDPNTRVCPVCTGMPGTLPTLNKRVVDLAIKAGLALNCSINKLSRHDRKNYFYPDLPKAYQISQNEIPLCVNGFVSVGTKKVEITRIHIEEDAGKLIHKSDVSIADYNRCGVPLIEIVTEPDMRSPEEAYSFLEILKSILEYTEVSDCKMQEGSLRCDINISVRPVGQKELNPRCEIKNVNSFSAALRAMKYEENRQIEVLNSGGMLTQQTRRWDDINGVSIVMRSKENAHDYRYFPEPDLASIKVSDEWIDKIRKTIPELPNTKRERFVNEYSLSEYEANILVSKKEFADFFEECVHLGVEPKASANWLMGDVTKILNETGCTSIPFTPADLSKLINLINNDTISSTAAKKVLVQMFKNPDDPEKIIKESGLFQVSDEGEITDMVNEILINNPQSVADYKSGKDRAFGFLVGQVMKLSGGRANPQIINKILKEKLQE